VDGKRAGRTGTLEDSNEKRPGQVINTCRSRGGRRKDHRTIKKKGNERGTKTRIHVGSKWVPTQKRMTPVEKKGSRGKKPGYREGPRGRGKKKKMERSGKNGPIKAGRTDLRGGETNAEQTSWSERKKRKDQRQTPEGGGNREAEEK